ncbi:MAG: Asp-tRNA(Asn)/Glu-tRNA(Gln) amidotransferase subunit GatC [Deltaproteobacteria bacterium]|nr:Asp-tRNA(Asn)/Glu-tRNA(Gln) amidotransferase subunit GatC [Deltaproteobacteria bacterium]
MKITRKEVEHIAHLSRLEFNEEEIGAFTEQLNSILTYFDKLQEIDTTAVEPTSHAIVVTNVFREDEVVVPSPREANLANAPDQEGYCFRVPKIIE